jgi:transposase
VASFESDLTPLPEDRESLEALVRSFLREHQREKQRADALELEHLREQKRANQLYLENLQLQKELLQLRKLYCGPRADRLESEQELAQACLDFALELERKPLHPDDLPPQTQIAAMPEYELRRVKKRAGRRALANFDHLPTTTHIHELTPDERACPCCGQERQEIGEEKSWQVDYLPGHFERIEHVRKKYACPQCESQAENPQIELASKPQTAIDKGLAGPGLLAFIVTSKFADYLPLYRLEDIFQRQGFEIARATQSIWCGDVADLVEPLYKFMADEVRQSHVVATDETTLPMQSPGQTHPARMWVYVGDRAHPYNVFDFTLNRSRDGPQHFLEDYHQVLLADGYGGYNGVVIGNQMTRAGCWAHTRRKFVDAETTAPEIARQAVELIRVLYAIEKQAADVSDAERLQLRQQQSAPLLAELRNRLLRWKEQLLPKHPMTEAVNYALSQWDELNVFVSDGAVPIDNNVSEREMKRVVLNRKNSLFVGNPRGGRTAAILASLTSSCRRHDVDPQLYFTQLLMNLPQTKMSDLADWLPNRWKILHAQRLANLQNTSDPIA